MTDFKIAGLKKVSDWKFLRDKLETNPTEELWQEAFDDFLQKRIKTRYLEPIEEIEKIGKQQGKGFSIVTIYCSLIEFFETQSKGYYYDKNYHDSTGEIARSEARKDKKGNLQPLSTEEVFVHFLTENEPFKSHFADLLAKDFYKHVRCSILHQAETTGGWIIKEGKESDQILSKDTYANILHWKPLKKSFELYLDSYGALLKTDTNTQKNFIAKWNKIANL